MDERVSLTGEQVAQRRLLWWALSDLMLDTDMPHVWGPHIARTMQSAGFTLAETRAIFVREVGPAFSFNLHDVAGEWLGWEEDYVAERVLRRLRRSRWLRWIDENLGDKVFVEVWEHTLPYIEAALRESQSQEETASADAKPGYDSDR